MFRDPLVTGLLGFGAGMVVMFLFVVAFLLAMGMPLRLILF